MMKLPLPVILTPSRSETASRCQRRHTLANVMHKARYLSPSLEFGSVIHAGAGAKWKRGSLITPIHAVQVEWENRFVKNNLTGKDLSLELAVGMIAQYDSQASLAGPFEWMGPWQIVSVEERLELNVAPGITLSLQTDRVVYNKERDHIVVLDTKTAGRMDARWAKQWELSLQMKLYKYAMQKLYGNANVDVVIEGLCKDLPLKIQYIPVPDWSTAVLEEAKNQFIKLAERDRETLMNPDLEDYAVNHTLTNYQDCMSYGIECPFRLLCVADPEERVGLLRGEYFNVESEY